MQRAGSPTMIAAALTNAPSAFAPLALPMARDAGIALFTAVAAVGWIGFWGRLAASGRISTSVSRKLVHVGCGPGFVIAWTLFSDLPSARLIACAVPVLSLLRILRAGLRSEGNSDIVRAVSRTGAPREALGGPLLYTLVLLAATSIGWRSHVAAVGVCMMAVGDGLADIVGRKFGRRKWPFSPDKSLAGSAAFVAGGFLSSLGVVALFAACGLTSLTVAQSAAPLLLITLLSAAVELLPASVADDNLSVPCVAAALTAFLLGTK